MAFKLQRVLVPVDFSAGSNNAFEYAKTLAETFGASIDVLHVVEPPRYSGPMLSFEGAALSLDAYGRKVAALELENFVAAHAKETKVRLHGILDFGEAAHEIVRIANKEPYDLIVMGTHGRTGVSHFLVGSVAEKVVRRARCPVLTVRVPEKLPAGEGGLQ